MKKVVILGEIRYSCFPNYRLFGARSLSPSISNLDRLAFAYCGFGCSIRKCDHSDILCINCPNHF